MGKKDSATMPSNFNINSKTATAPLAAFTMAVLLLVYSRTSIKAAKRNAELHREADGGQLNWHNENLRRHGKMAKPDGSGLGGNTEEGSVVGTVGELVNTAFDRKVPGRKGDMNIEAERMSAKEQSSGDARLREAMKRRGKGENDD